MDLKGVLNEQDSAPEPEKEQPDKDSAVRVHKKPIQLRDIENRSSSNRKTSLSHEINKLSIHNTIKVRFISFCIYFKTSY